MLLYRKYGKTNEMVSVLGFGCMRLPVIGGDPTNIDEEQSIAMIRHAIDEGVNYIDTAYPYHGKGMAYGGASEPFVAKALKDGYRERVKLATKLPSWLIKTRADMDKYLNEQLKRLETDTIDFYLVHSLSASTWPSLKEAGISEFLDQAIQDGRIKHAGFSFHERVGLFKEIVDYYDWSFCQIQYNYLDENYQAGKEGLEYAAKKGLGIAIMEPLRGGKIAENLPDDALSFFDQADQKRTPVEWALRWVWNHPEVSIALSGMSTMEHVTENLKIARDAHANSLTEKEINIINQVKSIFKERIKVNCTACAYCMPCPAGVNIPGCFTILNDNFIFGDSPAVRERHKFLYNFRIDSAAHASNCIECGKCESHCPQNISIRKELHTIKELFESA
ncbi:aldo/keto reductase [Pelosinus fermentans]|uniref:NADP-dependent oxidoreductase domain containing protein n=1 Tax=Pelosinus fermentans JBW45 TaxID=1192197 RepID=I8TXH8_9FIRM|nr:aldo/keto reductase [Pelosinus fermentans]AJQ28043.1 NADP-dependent oxidoreductase domain containing protein [Pelosinus fermentans JBW45]